MPEQLMCPEGGEAVHSPLADDAESAFVGRSMERALFRSLLRDTGQAPSVQYIHAMSGTGKSALLRQFAHDATEVGRTVLEVGGGRFATPRALSAAVGRIKDLNDPVLLIDDVDRCEGLEPWLRECFLPFLSQEAIVVLTGRRRPEPAWTADPGWARHARLRRLSHLRGHESVWLLDDLRVPRPLHAAVMAFAAGHPLALRAAAADALQRPAAPGAAAVAWSPAPSTTSYLFGRLVGPEPTSLHREALAVGAAAGIVTEGQLRAGMGHQAIAAFQWLRGQPYMTPVAGGLRMSTVLVHVVLAERARRSTDRTPLRSCSPGAVRRLCAPDR